MPFFYSQYLKDDKKAQRAKGTPTTLESSLSNSTNSRTPITKKAIISTPSKTPKKSSLRTTPSRLVWHSNVGSTTTGHHPNNRTPTLDTKRGGFFSAFHYNDPTKKKTVHFATIEVQPYHWDYSCDGDVYYKKEQITAMNKQRFTDASKLRKVRNIKVPSKKEREAQQLQQEQAKDDVDIAKRAANIQQLLNEAFDPNTDIDPDISIRGIEHFVYPVLQQEMIRQKKHAKKELLTFQQKKKPDPQGWRLARLSEANTQWAREVAIEKGMRYCMNQEMIYGEEECGISKDELERSKDELDNLHKITSSASCASPASVVSSSVDSAGGGAGSPGSPRRRRRRKSINQYDERRASRLADSLVGSRLDGLSGDVRLLMENVTLANQNQNYTEGRSVDGSSVSTLGGESGGGEGGQSAGADTRED